jgi:GT2 family glycosyltransferase
VSEPLLDIVIVTAPGCAGYVEACLSSLRERPLTAGSQRVTVVDNASGDGTEQIVRAFPAVGWRGLASNVGFSAANNIVLRRSGAEHVLLLNPDTEVRAGALDACVARLAADERIGIVGCRLVGRDGVGDPNAKRTLPTRAAALRRLSFADRALGAGSYHTPQLAFADCGPVGAVSGAFMMIRRAVIESIGVLDEGFWMYGEDLDYCARARDAGWIVWYEGAAETLHVKGGASGGRRSLRTTVAFHRAMGRYYRRHLSSGGPLDLAIYAGIVLRLTLAAALSLSRPRRAARTPSAP